MAADSPAAAIVRTRRPGSPSPCLAGNHYAAPRVAVVWAGVVPYFSERPSVDLLGKNDRRIAKGPSQSYAEPPLTFFASAPVAYCWPGHTKYDYHYSIEELSPDVILDWWHGMEAISDVLQERYSKGILGGEMIMIKKGSPEVNIAAAPPER